MKGFEACIALEKKRKSVFEKLSFSLQSE